MENSYTSLPEEMETLKRILSDELTFWPLHHMTSEDVHDVIKALIKVIENLEARIQLLEK